VDGQSRDNDDDDDYNVLPNKLCLLKFETDSTTETELQSLL